MFRTLLRLAPAAAESAGPSSATRYSMPKASPLRESARWRRWENRSKKRNPLGDLERLYQPKDWAAAIPRPARVPPAIQPVTTPFEFLKAVSCGPRRDLTASKDLVQLVGEEWNRMWTLTSFDFKKAGVAIKERRYVLWAMEKFRQGWKPEDFRIKPKKRKVVRGWGPRVQKGYRVSGVRRPGEKKPN